MDSNPKVFPITRFSATINCGSNSNTWTYSGVDNSDGHSLNYANDKISVDSYTGKISVSN